MTRGYAPLPAALQGAVPPFRSDPGQSNRQPCSPQGVYFCVHNSPISFPMSVHEYVSAKRGESCVFKILALFLQRELGVKSSEQSRDINRKQTQLQEDAFRLTIIYQLLRGSYHSVCGGSSSRLKGDDPTREGFTPHKVALAMAAHSIQKSVNYK